MKQEIELKLQAYLDGELSPRQARKVAGWVASDQEAQNLLTELRITKAALTGAEPEMALPESPEFYWSKIQQAISQAEQAEPQLQPHPVWRFFTAWRKLLAPMAGLALITFLSVYTFTMSDAQDDSKHHLAVVENLSEHTGAYSFRSQSQNMFVIWVYDRTQETDAESEPADDQAEQ
jgi:anti-sigma factor RsiW